MSGDSTPVVPPPWTLHGDAYVLPVWVPAGVELRGEEQPEACERRRGGLALLMFVRYEHSSVGAYDELLWVALRAVRCAGPAPTARERSGAWRHAVTSILVSSEPSRAGGRANWGLPKRLGDFEVTRTAGGAEHVRVSLGGEHVAAFDVSAGARSLPMDARLIPRSARTLLQAQGGSCFETSPTARGRLHAASFSRLSFGSEHFPDPTRGRLLPAFALRGFEMTFPRAHVNSTLAPRAHRRAASVGAQTR